MDYNALTFKTSFDVNLSPGETFDLFISEMATALHMKRMEFKTGPGGKIMQDNFEVGEITIWEPSQRVRMLWKPASWDADLVTEIELKFTASGSGCRVELFQWGWDKVISGPEELTGWFASSFFSSLFQSMTPLELGDWITDRRARRPSGEGSRNVYRNPLYHYPGFKVISSLLELTASDYLLDVCCGGGAFLKDALKSGCKAAGIDHSIEMVETTEFENRKSIHEGRLEVREAGADHIPFHDETFSCITLMGALGFLSDPVAVFKEFHRLLVKGGRIVIQGSDPGLKGSPAAPYPIADRLNFYDDVEFKNIALKAGFSAAAVLKINMEPYARETGIPEEHLPLFSRSKSLYLKAVKN